MAILLCFKSKLELAVPSGMMSKTGNCTKIILSTLSEDNTKVFKENTMTSSEELSSNMLFNLK